VVAVVVAVVVGGEMKVIYKWCHSLYEDEQFQGHETREEAIFEGAAEARDHDADSFFIAPIIPPDLNEIVTVDSDSIIERFVENAYDQMPEDWQWLDKVPRDQIEELNGLIASVIVEWMRKHGHEPNWFSVGKVEEIKMETNIE
jgi:hypothetical protein